MLYEIVYNLIGPVPLEFEFIYGLGTIVACVFGILLIFMPIMLAIKFLGG